MNQQVFPGKPLTEPAPRKRTPERRISGLSWPLGASSRRASPFRENGRRPCGAERESSAVL